MTDWTARSTHFALPDRMTEIVVRIQENNPLSQDATALRHIASYIDQDLPTANKSLATKGNATKLTPHFADLRRSYCRSSTAGRCSWRFVKPQNDSFFVELNQLFRCSIDTQAANHSIAILTIAACLLDILFWCAFQPCCLLGRA
jgi:hypothetical protein